MNWTVNVSSLRSLIESAEYAFSTDNDDSLKACMRDIGKRIGPVLDSIMQELNQSEADDYQSLMKTWEEASEALIESYKHFPEPELLKKASIALLFWSLLAGETNRTKDLCDNMQKHFGQSFQVDLQITIH